LGQQQEIDFEAFLRTNGIILLGFPKVNLTAGEIYESELDSPHILDNTGDLTDIISLKDNQSKISLNLPELIEQPVGIDLHGIITFGAKKEFGISIGEKILKFLKIQTSVKREKTEMAECKMASVNYIEMKIRKIQAALRSFVVDERYRSNLVYYYVVTKVFFCEGFNMTFFDVDSTELEILTKAAADVKGKLEVENHGLKKITLKSSQSIAFGVNLAKFDYPLLTGEITITPFTFAKKPILKAPTGETEETEESIAKVFLVNSEENE
jgi:hypothetical protein